MKSPIALLKAVIKRALLRLGYEVHRMNRTLGGLNYEPVRPIATYAPWKSDKAFQAVYQAVASNTLVDKYRCYELWTLVEQVRHLSGGIIEIGVWRGGTGALMAAQAKRCDIREKVYLCDTFRGVVKTGPMDSSFKGGEVADTSREVVRALVETALGLDNVEILEGVFPDETSHAIPDAHFRLCHIDVDAYQSAKDIIDWIWPRMPLGGIVVYDDYGFWGCDGIAKFVDEQRGERDRLVIHNLNGHAVVVKIR